MSCFAYFEFDYSNSQFADHDSVLASAGARTKWDHPAIINWIA